MDNSQNEIIEEEFEYDRQIRIKITNQNYINLILIYIHIFLYSFFGIIPYIVLFILCNKNENIKYYEIGIALSTSHLGSLLSKYTISNYEKYKFPFIFFGICSFVSFTLTLMSYAIIIEVGDNEYFFINKYILFFIFNVLSRFIFGLCGGRVIIRKYINLFLPESKMRCFSILYMFLVYLGNIIGILFLFIILLIDIDFQISILKVDIISISFIIGFFISLLYLFLIIIFFTEPDGNKGKMLSHEITINDKENKINIKKEKHKEDLELINNEDNITINNNIIEKENIEEIPLVKIKSLITGNQIIYLEDEEDYKSINAKSENKRKSNINKFTINNSKKNSKKASCSTLNLISTSSENETIKKRSFIKASEEMQEKLLSSEEIKGLNSIEKAIISINNKNNFNDTNLFPKELDRIKQNQFKNNKRFVKTIVVFILYLNISNIINEFIFLLVQINVKIGDNNIIISNKYDNDDIKKILFFVLLMQLIEFFFLIILIKSSITNIKKKLLLILNLFLLLSISGMFISLIKNLKNIYVIIIISFFLIYSVNNLLIGFTSLFCDRIVPSFIKFCFFNVKYLISYISTLGKLLGGISFCLMMYLMEKNNNDLKKYLIIFAIIFDSLSLLSFFVLCANYKSLRMRALSKLKTIQD